MSPRLVPSPSSRQRPAAGARVYTPTTELARERLGEAVVLAAREAVAVVVEQRQQRLHEVHWNPSSPRRGGDDRSGDRTRDLKIKSLLLYQLSYPVGPAANRIIARRGASHNAPARTRLPAMPHASPVTPR